MNLITKRELLRTFAERYGAAVSSKLSFDGDRKVYTDLIRLGENPTEKQILAALGPQSYMADKLLAIPSCFVCNGSHPQVVHLKTFAVGTAARASSNRVSETGHLALHICGDCLIRALNLTEENC